MDDSPSEELKETHERLVKDAYDVGMATKEGPGSFPRLHPSSALHACSGTDIVHSSSHRKSKFLFALPGQILFTKGGVIGRITHMDTPNPILYLNFPQGSFKLHGTVIRTRAKYLVLQCRPARGSAKATAKTANSGIVCDDVFRAIVAFSSVQWIGQPDKNPEELAEEPPTSLTEIPKAIQAIHEDLRFRKGSGWPTVRPAGAKASAERTGSADGNTSSASSRGSSDERREKPSTDRRTVRRRRSAVVAATYADSDSGSDFEESEAASSGSDSDVVEVTSRSGAAQPTGSRGRRKLPTAAERDDTGVTVTEEIVERASSAKRETAPPPAEPSEAAHPLDNPSSLSFVAWDSSPLRNKRAREEDSSSSDAEVEEVGVDAAPRKKRPRRASSTRRRREEKASQSSSDDQTSEPEDDDSESWSGNDSD